MFRYTSSYESTVQLKTEQHLPTYPKRSPSATTSVIVDFYSWRGVTKIYTKGLDSTSMWTMQCSPSNREPRDTARKIDENLSVTVMVTVPILLISRTHSCIYGHLAYGSRWDSSHGPPIQSLSCIQNDDLVIWSNNF